MYSLLNQSALDDLFSDDDDYCFSNSLLDMPIRKEPILKPFP